MQPISIQPSLSEHSEFRVQGNRWQVVDPDENLVLHQGKFCSDGSVIVSGVGFIPVDYWHSDSGNCRDYFKHAVTGKPICLQMDTRTTDVWYAVTGDQDYLEPDYALSSEFVHRATGIKITHRSQIADLLT